MRTVFVIALLLAFAPTAYAHESDRPAPADTEVQARIVDQGNVPPQIAPVLTPAVVSERQPAETQNMAMAAQQTRGWVWTIGAIVIAGLILAGLGVI
ncbi:hypothetical protein BH23GEM3_BH23GEM3_14080 [soil metagenome]|jgi:hypothetical protein|nr:hypothetical protein [Gemmatimonadota bacterium]